MFAFEKPWREKTRCVCMWTHNDWTKDIHILLNGKNFKAYLQLKRAEKSTMGEVVERVSFSRYSRANPCLYSLRVLLAQACIEWNDGCYSDRNISRVTWSNSSQLLLNVPPKWAELLLFSSFPLIKLANCALRHDDKQSVYARVGYVLALEQVFPFVFILNHSW